MPPWPNQRWPMVLKLAQGIVPLLESIGPSFAAPSPATHEQHRQYCPPHLLHALQDDYADPIFPSANSNKTKMIITVFTAERVRLAFETNTLNKVEELYNALEARVADIRARSRSYTSVYCLIVELRTATGEYNVAKIFNPFGHLIGALYYKSNPRAAGYITHDYAFVLNYVVSCISQEVNLTEDTYIFWVPRSFLGILYVLR
ncbi:uncharacterized protein ARMOST_15240 [Armillaria ostoyae]|uniref:Uncharacterized protein n=1 Tax=Armillaria ostoyae TaxID=47428 RepID=A0A284RSV7_ARMOS|nr:uncharacterized protein ARMOST_15240 [Armillaria ostoyae]